VLISAFVLGGCVNSRAVDLEGKECPCAEGWVCDTAMNVCVVDGPGPADSGARDSAVGDSGTTDSATGDTGAPVDSGAMDDSGAMVPGMVKLWFEAEAATLDTEMMVGTDATASGGEYISAANPGPVDTQPGPDGKASFRVMIPFDGTYRIWGRVIAPGESADSFWVCVDVAVAPPGAADCSRWNSILTMTEWGWDDVHDDGDPSLPPTDFVLEAGEITVDIYRREAAVQLDKILVTDDLTFMPSGTGD